MKGDANDVSTTMPLFWGDYRAATPDLDCTEHGAYLQLLGDLWVEGGYLEADPARLAARCHCPPKQWMRVWNRIGRFFQLEADPPRISQKRVLAELEKARDKKRRRTDIAMLGANGRWGNRRNADGNADSIPPQGMPRDGMQTVCPSSSSSSLDPKTDPDPSPSAKVAPRSFLNDSEPAKPKADAKQALLVFPVVPGSKSSATEWIFTDAEAAILREGYPDLDVISEARSAWAWVKAKPKKRKTASGMMAFLVNWCARTQNRGGARAPGSPARANGSPAPGSMAAKNQASFEALAAFKAAGEKRDETR